MQFENVIGQSTGWRKIEYNWRDVALYALAVGAGEDELMYYYEKGMKALPSYGVVPYWSAVNNEPQQPIPFPAANLARELMIKELGHEFAQGLHMGHELIMHKPIDPIKGSLVFKDTISNIYDRGEGKGVIIETNVPVYDEAGQLICENISTTHMQTSGGFGGPKPPKARIEYPEREPDYVVDCQLLKTQSALYRLTGDTNYLHIDPEYAATAGFGGKVIMQGLASFGIACRMMIKAVIPNEPERMTRIKVQMRSVGFPGAPVQVRGWKIGEGKAVFKYIDMESGKAVLDNCEFMWK